MGAAWEPRWWPLPSTGRRPEGCTKLTLSVFPDNESAIALYRKFGSWKRDGSPKHLRRDSGELWDLIEMGLLL